MKSNLKKYPKIKLLGTSYLPTILKDKPYNIILINEV